MKKTVVLFGGIAGIVMSLGIILPFFLRDSAEGFDYDKSEVIGYTLMFLSTLITILLGVLSYRKRNEGKLKYGKAFLLGLGISAFAGLIFGIGTTALYSVKTDLSQQMGEMYAEKIQSNPEMTDDERTAALAQMEQMLDAPPIFQGVIMAVTVILVGIFSSLLILLGLFIMNKVQARNT